MNDLHIVINGDPGTIFCDLSKSPMDLLNLSDVSEVFSENLCANH